MRAYCRRKRRSLSGKLVFLFIAMAAVLIVSVGSIVAWSFRAHFEENIRPHLMQYLEYIRAEIGTPPDQEKAKELAQKLSLDIHYFSSEHQWSTDVTPLNLEELSFYRQFSQAGVDYGFGHSYEREYLIARYEDFTLAFSIPHENKNILHKVVPVLVVLLVLVFLYHATRRLFSPIADLKEGIARIGQGELSHRIDIKRNDELGELGSSINSMADDIEQMLEAKRQLLLAISHELRSPLTRAKVATELLENPKQRDEINQDLDEMEKLIEELLETERLSTRHSTLNKSDVVMQALVNQLLQEYFPNNGFDLQMPEQQIVLSLDQARIKLLLKNILDNAMRHNPPEASPPSLLMDLRDEFIYLTVKDHGSGIEEQHLAHLTEPFYRTDKARQRKTGGYGLGLYLCKVIVEAHGGALHIVSQPGKGTEVTIKLPLRS